MSKGFSSTCRDMTSPGIASHSVCGASSFFKKFARRCAKHITSPTCFATRLPPCPLATLQPAETSVTSFHHRNDPCPPHVMIRFTNTLRPSSLYPTRSAAVTILCSAFACLSPHQFLLNLHKLQNFDSFETYLTVFILQIPLLSFNMGVEESVYLAKLAEQAERYEGQSFRCAVLIR
jgi:hypothetical protein